MYWSSTDSTGYVKTIPGATNTDTPEKGALEQVKDDDSLQSFYRRAVRLKSQNPEISRGKVTAVDVGNGEVAAYISEYEGSKVMVLLNISDKANTVNIPSDKFTIGEVRGYLKADSGDAGASESSDPFAAITGDNQSSAQESAAEQSSDFSVKSDSVTLPPYSAIVVK